MWRNLCKRVGTCIIKSAWDYVRPCGGAHTCAQPCGIWRARRAESAGIRVHASPTDNTAAAAQAASRADVTFVVVGTTSGATPGRQPRRQVWWRATWGGRLQSLVWLLTDHGITACLDMISCPSEAQPGSSCAADRPNDDARPELGRGHNHGRGRQGGLHRWHVQGEPQEALQTVQVSTHWAAVLASLGPWSFANRNR